MGGMVAEVQGLYGPFGLPEFVVQGIWSRGEFVREGLRVEDGRRLVVERVGSWNRGAGPDFNGCCIYLDGVRTEGDVEVHVRPSDWDAHGHAADPSYSAVVLHVCLYADTSGRRTIGWGGAEIPVLSLLPYLWQDVESCAIDDALGAALPVGAAQPSAEFDDRAIAGASLRRWEQKRVRARARLEAWGWAQALHATTLEVLGFSTNRAPMLALALRVPVDFWSSRVSHEVVRGWMDDVPGWKRRGMRPANFPERRVAAYLSWTVARPEWIEALRDVRALPVSQPEETPRQWRARVGWAKWEAELAKQLTGENVGGSRWRTWLLDAALPLLCAAGRWGEHESYCAWNFGPEAELRSPASAGAEASRCNGRAQGVRALQTGKNPREIGGCEA